MVNENQTQIANGNSKSIKNIKSVNRNNEAANKKNTNQKSQQSEKTSNQKTQSNEQNKPNNNNNENNLNAHKINSKFAQPQQETANHFEPEREQKSYPPLDNYLDQFDNLDNFEDKDFYPRKQSPIPQQNHPNLPRQTNQFQNNNSHFESGNPAPNNTNSNIPVNNKKANNVKVELAKPNLKTLNANTKNAGNKKVTQLPNKVESKKEERLQATNFIHQESDESSSKEWANSERDRYLPEIFSIDSNGEYEGDNEAYLNKNLENLKNKKVKETKKANNNKVVLKSDETANKSSNEAKKVGKEKPREKEMKSRNNQSSFAKNPTQSYADQYHASLPPNMKPAKLPIPFYDLYTPRDYINPYAPPYTYLPSMIPPVANHPITYPYASPFFYNSPAGLLHYNMWLRPNLSDEKDPSLHDLLYYDNFRNKDVSYANKHVEKKIREIDGYYNPYERYTVRDYKNLKTGMSFGKDDPETPKEKSERLQRRKEYGNSVFKTNPNPQRANQLGEIYATSNQNTSRNVGVHSNPELPSRLPPVDYNNNYNYDNRNYNSLSYDFQKNADIDNLFELNNDSIELTNLKAYNSNYNNSQAVPSYYRNYEAGTKDAKPFANHTRYNMPPLEPNIKNKDIIQYY